MTKRRSKSNWRAMRPEVMQLEARRLLAITASWVGQSSNGVFEDHVGPEAGTGPDGVYDDVIQATGIDTTNLPDGSGGSTTVTLNDFDVTDGSFANATTLAWIPTEGKPANKSLRSASDTADTSRLRPIGLVIVSQE